MMNPLEVWVRGEPITAAKSNEAIEAINRHMVAFANSGINAFQTMGGTSYEVLEQPRQVLAHRAQVTTPDAGQDVVLVKFYDGNEQTGAEFPVRVYWQREVDDELYVFVPGGGTDAVYNNAAVEWMEIYTLGTPQYQGMSVTAPTQGAVAWDFQRAYTMPQEA